MNANDKDMIALIQAMAYAPKRDNSAYHKAMAEARQAFEQAEQTLGGPVRVKTVTKRKTNGNFVVKWIFKPAS